VEANPSDASPIGDRFGRRERQNNSGRFRGAMEDPGDAKLFQNATNRKDPEMNLIKTFLTEEDGPTAVEYAVMLSLIVVVCIVAVRAIGTSASSTFNRVSTEIQNAGGS
jgi:pilus assembly protein Flp/PilA